MPDVIGARCYRCEHPFTAEEWEARHTDEETGEDVHAYCCEEPGCVGEYDPPLFRCEECGSANVSSTFHHVRTLVGRNGDEHADGYTVVSCAACGHESCEHDTDI